MIAPAPRSRHCHCLCSHNHPDRLGVCKLPGYRMLVVAEGPGPWWGAPVCRRCAKLAPEIVSTDSPDPDAPV